MVKIMSAPTKRSKPMVDAHASDASLWVRVGVKVSAQHSVWMGGWVQV